MHERPVGLARRDQVEHPAALGEAGRLDRRDVVAEPALGELEPVLGPLGVVAERRAGARGDHGRVARRRAGARLDAGVAGALDDRGPGCDRLLVELTGQVLGAVRDRVAAEGLAEHIGVIVGQRVVQALEDRRVEGRVRVPEHLHHVEAGAGGDASDRDVAARRKRVRGVHELRDVVGDPALSGDRAGVSERLRRARGRVRSLATEVLVVGDHVAAVGTNQIGVVDVDAVGERRDLDARAGGQVLGLRRARVIERGVRRLQRLGLEQRLGRVGRAQRLAVGRGRAPATRRAAPSRRHSRRDR